jgi:hypothetical protein
MKIIAANAKALMAAAKLCFPPMSVPLSPVPRSGAFSRGAVAAAQTLIRLPRDFVTQM